MLPRSTKVSILRNSFGALLLLCAMGMFAQPAINFRHITTADGLPESTGQALAEDSLGFIWIGTQSGLVRYDGTDMQVFKADPNDPSALPSNQIEGLLFDQRNRLWITTRGGLCRYDAEMNHFVRYPLNTPQCPASDCNWFSPLITEDSKGRIWTNNFYGAVIIHPNDSLSYLDFPGEDRLIIGYCEHENNLLLVKDDSMYTFDPDASGLIGTDHLPAQATAVYSIDQKIILTTYNGVYEKTAVGGESEWNELFSLKGTFALGQYPDSRGNVWTTTTEGIYLTDRDGHTWNFNHSTENPSSLSQSLALSFLEDQRGWIWIGTGDGVNVYNPNTPRLVHAQFLNHWQLPSEPVEALTIDKHRNLWIAVADKLIKITPDFTQDLPYESGSSTIYGPSDFDEETPVNFDYLFADEDTLWAGMFSGRLFKIIIPSGQVQSAGGKPELDRLRSIIRIDEGLLLGYAMGTRLYRNGKIHPYDDGLGNPAVVQIARTSPVSFWIGSPSALIYSNGKSVRSFSSGPDREKPAGTMLTSGIELGESTWLSTFGTGLLKYKGGEFTTFNESTGFPDDNVWSVYEHDGILWCSTDKGIVAFDPDAHSSHLYSGPEGLYSSDYIMSAHAQSQDGTMFFGHPEGLTILYPERPEQTNPLVTLSEVRVNYEVAPSKFIDFINSGTLKIMPGESSLNLKFSNSAFGSGSEVPMWWKWSIDSGWIALDKRQSQLSFTNLSPGKHELQVRIGNGKLTSIPIEVIPPFYQTAWFKTLAVFVLILLTGGLVLWFNRIRYMRRIRSLETERSIQAERERISKDLHDYVGAHLTRISSDLDIHLLSRPELSEEDRESLQSTRDFTQNTVQLLRDTIWAINEDTFSIHEFAKRIETFLESYLGDFVEWQVTTEGNSEHILRPKDALNLLRIIQESTQNMLKYAQANQFGIGFKTSANEIVLTISDDGIGMTDTVSPENSFGLNNIRERAANIGATCEIFTAKGEGVTLKFVIKRK